MNRWHILLICLALIGVFDSGYLTIEHYQNTIPPCTVNQFFGDCGQVLRSEYSLVFGIPLALIGFFHYSIFTISLVIGSVYKKREANILSLVLSVVGLVCSFYFVFLQLVIIKAICLYCMGSAITSVLLFFFVQFVFREERKRVVVSLLSALYGQMIKPIFFLIEPERIHNIATTTGEIVGNIPVIRWLMSFLLVYKHPSLEQHVAGIYVQSPIGLAAGFDYEAKLTQILPAIGFGFQSVGTITNHAYQGNPHPMLGRLPKSQSLMVNKGFKNLGVKKTIEKLTGLNFATPVGISIGKTNTIKLRTQKQSIEDIVKAFIQCEDSKVNHAYYELNISCPNLYGNITFYPKKNLEDLLKEIDKVQLIRPLFIKMPIDKSDKETLDMLDIIARHSPAGVIFGNLQKNRSHPTLDPIEVAKYKVGNFSGKPTQERSNQLIKLTYKHYKDRFDIIGCGGIFSAEDAYEKITFGASLVQLITGMIFKGPQLITEINIGLVELLRKDGFTHISQAVGSRNT